MFTRSCCSQIKSRIKKYSMMKRPAAAVGTLARTKKKVSLMKQKVDWKKVAAQLGIKKKKSSATNEGNQEPTVADNVIKRRPAAAPKSDDLSDAGGSDKSDAGESEEEEVDDTSAAGDSNKSDGGQTAADPDLAAAKNKREKHVATAQVAKKIGLNLSGSLKSRIEQYCKAMIEQDLGTLRQMHLPALFSAAEMSSLWQMLKGWIAKAGSTTCCLLCAVLCFAVLLCICGILLLLLLKII